MKKMLISLFSFICLVCFLYFKSSTVFAEERWTYQDCLDLVSFIDAHFNQFVDEYNANNKEILKATSIEYSTIINLIEDDNYGIYLDFNDDNGYCVMTGDNTIYTLEVKGDYKELREEEKLYYSYIDGFVYLEESGVYKRQIKDENKKNSNQALKTYPGQTEPGDGKISYRYINDYIDQRYPDYQYEEQNVNLRDNFKYYSQKELSYFNQYKCNSDGTIYANYNEYYSEGNCSLTAMTSVLTSWASKGFIKNIDYNGTSNIISSIKNHPQFEKWGSGKILYSSNGDVCGTVQHKENNSNNPLLSSGNVNYEYYCWLINLKLPLSKMSNLYSNLREYAVNQFGYTPISGLYTDQILSTLNNMPKQYYNQNINVYLTDSVTSAVDSINTGKAVYMAINGSSTYQDHAVVLLGYQKYSYTTGWWVFKKTHYVYFYEIADGWKVSSNYFDPNTDANPSMEYLILS